MTRRRNTFVPNPRSKSRLPSLPSDVDFRPDTPACLLCGSHPPPISGTVFICLSNQHLLSRNCHLGVKCRSLWGCLCLHKGQTPRMAKPVGSRVGRPCGGQVQGGSPSTGPFSGPRATLQQTQAGSEKGVPCARGRWFGSTASTPTILPC